MSKIGDSTVAVILARGGSKGVPFKNLKPILGTPLVEWSLRAARASKLIDKVILSSDDEDIRQIGYRLGCEVHERRAEDALDSTSSEQSLLAAINEHPAATEASIVILIQPTSPFTTPKDLDSAIEIFEERGLDSLVTVVQNHTFLWEIGINGLASPNYDPKNRPRRQDMMEQFAENGAFYITNREILEKQGCRLGGKIGAYLMDAHHSVELDEETDLVILEALAKTLRLVPEPISD